MAKIEYRFKSKGLGPDQALFVVDFKGMESISEPYEFTINLKSKEAEIDFESILSNQCTFEIDVDGEVRVFHGVLSVFDQLHQHGEYTFYQAVLVPRLWQLSLYKTNEIYLDMTIEDIIKQIMEECEIPSLDFEIKLTGSYTKWPFRCQFGETHLQFISRLMEHQGIYYYFEQGDSAEKIIFSDSSQHQKALDDPKVTYSPVSGLDTGTVFSNIHSLVCRNNRLPKNMTVKDYNYEKPSLDVKGNSVIDNKGIGEVFNYGENFDTPEEGKQLAEVRAQELSCTKERFYGEGAVFRLTTGSLFELEEHFRGDFNQEYLVVSVSHEGQMPSHLTGDSPIQDYHNSFTAIASSVQFRAQQNTPKPRFYGTINAVIDAEQEGEYAELDDQGRYKVLFPFDRVTEHEGGKASHWVRMAQPYGGSREGMFFPLRKGTEVLLTFINGDPDQPVISGVVPNTANPSVIDANSQSNSRILTSSGNMIELEDKDGKSRIKLRTPSESSYFHLGAANAKGEGIVSLTTGLRRMEHLGGMQKSTVTSLKRPESVEAYISSASDDGSTESKEAHKDILEESELFEFPRRGMNGAKVGSPREALESNYSDTKANKIKNIDKIVKKIDDYNSEKGVTVNAKVSYGEEISGAYIMERRVADRYFYAEGNDYSYGGGNEFNFGNGLSVTHWDQETETGAKDLIDVMWGYELKGLKEYSGDEITPEDGITKWKTLLNKGQVELTESDAFCAHNGNIYDFGGCWNYNLGNGYEENHMAQGGQEMNKQHEKDFAPAGPPCDGYSIKHLESHGQNVGVSKTIACPGYDYAVDSPGVDVAVRCDSYEYSYGGVSKSWTYTSDGTKIGYEEEDPDAGTTRTEEYSADGGTMMCLNKVTTKGQNYSEENFTMVASSTMDLSLGATNSFEMRLAADSEISIFAGVTSAINMTGAASSEINLTAGASSEINLTAGVGLSVDIFAGPKLEVELIPAKIEVDLSKVDLKSPAAALKAVIASVQIAKYSPVEVKSKVIDLQQKALELKNAQKIST